MPRVIDKTEPIWIPSPSRIAASNMIAFMEYVRTKGDCNFPDYDTLYRWSIDNPVNFWRAISEFAQVKYSRPADAILEGDDIMTAKWFTGARLNFAENLLRYRDDTTAIIAESESRPLITLSYEQLYRRVASCASHFRQLGLSPGDRVAALVPNTAEAVVAMLAATSLGAIWSSCSPDFGFDGVMDRFGQINPRLLIGANGYEYNGRVFDSVDTLHKLQSSIDSIENVVLIPHLDQIGVPAPDSWLDWNDIIAHKVNSIEFEQLPFDHPLYIMYSSGTTGVPKCIVHGAGGTLLQHLKELVLHTDLKRDDTVTYFTTCGWMMWNWLVSSLAVGATVYLYDGSPSHPNLGTLFRAVEKHQITVFGTSPKFLSSCEKTGLRPSEDYDLSSLKTILSTGSPLSDRNFRYVYDHIGPDLQLSSISGGTDIISCFLLGNPILPVYRGELQCRGLGMKVEAYDETGQSVLNQTGELVCTGPFPSRPVKFWDDPDSAKYREAYFEHYPGVWRHGDYISINERGGAVIYGRSDATLNPGGVRIGTAEIYEPVESMAEIRDSLVVGQRINGDTRIILFVVPVEGIALDDSLKAKIRHRLKTDRTPRHIPQLILEVADIPRTISGKKVELAVTRIIHGEPVSNRDALANPESLDQFENIAELQAD